jgi:hypothetical protein
MESSREGEQPKRRLKNWAVVSPFQGLSDFDEGPRATLVPRFALGYLLASLRDFVADGAWSGRKTVTAFFEEVTI